MTDAGWDITSPSVNTSDNSIGSYEDSLSGRAFLVEERRPKESLEICGKYTSEGAKLLIISRDPPHQLLSGTSLVPERMIWLTNLTGKDRMNPTAIGCIMGEVRKFIEQSDNRAVVLIDGFEYLASLNTFSLMLQFANQLRDLFVTTGAILIMPIDMRTLADREQALLERDFQIISSTDSMTGGIAPENLVHIPDRENFST